MRNTIPDAFSEGFQVGQGADLTSDLGNIFDELCKHGGFCNHLDPAKLLVDNPVLDARTFAIEMLKAEGFPDPELELRWIRKFQRLFIHRYGEQISAESYKRRFGTP